MAPNVGLQARDGTETNDTWFFFHQLTTYMILSRGCINCLNIYRLLTCMGDGDGLLSTVVVSRDGENRRYWVL